MSRSRLDFRSECASLQRGCATARHRSLAVATAFFAVVAGAGCSGGGGTSPNYTATTSPSHTATPSPAPSASSSASTLQVVTLALPSSSIGEENDPTFGLVAGYTQALYSQTLAFAPGSQIMIRNGQSGIPHTLGDLGTTSFPASQPASLSTTSSGASTIGAGFQSGTIAPGAEVGPFTLSAGTYFIGCAYHYQSEGMRDVLVVSAAATPGPEATPPPGVTPGVY